jgi:hypothetical protein
LQEVVSLQGEGGPDGVLTVRGKLGLGQRTWRRKYLSRWYVMRKDRKAVTYINGIPPEKSIVTKTTPKCSPYFSDKGKSGPSKEWLSSL